MIEWSLTGSIHTLTYTFWEKVGGRVLPVHAATGKRHAQVGLGLLLGVTEHLPGPAVVLQLALDVAGAAQDAVDGGSGPGEVRWGVTCV